jgi:uncharacterized coiled-coil DUF342 family protein
MSGKKATTTTKQQRPGDRAPAGAGRGKPPLRLNFKQEVDEAVFRNYAIPKQNPPNRDGFQAELKQFDEQMNKLRSELNETQKQIDGTIENRKKLLDEQRTLIEQLKARRANIDKFKEGKKKFFDERKSHEEFRKKKIEELNKLKDKLPAKLRGAGPFNLKATLDSIDLKIHKLESKLKVTTMSLHDEKQVVSKISTLNAAKKLARDYDQEWQRAQGTLRSDDKPQEKGRSLVKEADENIAAAQVELNKLSLQLDGVRAKINGLNDTFQELVKKRDQLRQEREGVYQKRLASLQKRDEEEKKFGEYMSQLNEFRSIEREKLSAKKAEEREKRQNEHLMAQLNATQFEDELETCDRLIKYLGQFHIKEETPAEPVDTQAATPAPSTSAPAAPSVPDDMVVLKRDDDEGAPLKSKQRKQPRKPKAAALKPDSVLKHDLGVFRDFEMLSLAVPMVAAEVTKAVQDIKQKKERYVQLGVEKKKQLEIQIAKMIEEQKQKDAALAAGTSTDDTTNEANDDSTADAEPATTTEEVQS